MFIPADIREILEHRHRGMKGAAREEALAFALKGAYYKRASEKIQDLNFHDCRVYYGQKAVKAKISLRCAKLAMAVVRGTIKTWDGLLGELDDWIYMDRQAIRKGVIA